MLGFLNTAKSNKEKIKKAKVILMCGLPGSGKTTIAKNLSKILKASYISSDEIRKKVFNSARFDPKGDLHVMGLREKNYALLIKKAKKSFLKKKKIVIDASNMDKQRVKLIKSLSVLTSKKDLLILQVKTAKKTIAQRMAKVKFKNTENENMFSAWQRVYGYFEKHLKEKTYFWPQKKEGVTIIKINNG